MTLSWLKNLKIRNKLNLSFSVLIVIVILIETITFSHNKKTADLWEAISEETIPEIQLIYEIKTLSLRHISSINEVLATVSISNNAKTLPLLAEELEEVEESGEILSEKITIFEKFALGIFAEDEERIIREGEEDEEVLFEEVRSASNILIDAGQELINETVLKRNPLKSREEIELAEGQFLIAIDALIENENEDIAVQTQHFTKLALISTISSFLLGVTSILAAIALAFLISKVILQPLIELNEATNKLSKGNFNHKLRTRSKDEIGQLTKTFDFMRGQIKDFYSNLEKKVKNKTNQLRLEKNKLETLIDSIGEGLIAINGNGEIIMSNKIARKILKLNPDDMPKLNKLSLYNQYNKKLTIEAIRASDAYSKKKAVFSVYELRTKGKNHTPLATTISPILNGKKITGFVAAFRDITKEQEVEKSKNDFISLASHQIRTPLTGIKWMLEEAKNMGDIKKWEKAYFKDLSIATDRMFALVHDFLNVSRLEDGDIGFDAEKFTLCDLITEIIDGPAGLAAKKKNQKITFKKPIKKIIISFDRQLLNNVISNLISNAIYYSEKSKKIEIKLKRTKDYININIIDQGIGISKKDQANLFNKFYRTEEAAKYSTTGSGLGLYIVKKAMEISGGNVSIASKKGVGSTFTIKVPLNPNFSKKSGEKLFEHVI